MEEAFLNEDELHVVSALLLLSTTHSSYQKYNEIGNFYRIRVPEIVAIMSSFWRVKNIFEISQVAALSYTAVSDSKSKSTDTSTVTTDDDDTHSASLKVKSKSDTSQIVALSYATSLSDSKFKSTDSSTTTADDDDDMDNDASFSEVKANARSMKMIWMIRVINNLKAVRRRRSKSLCISSGKPKTATSLTISCTSASSCVSIDSADGDISSCSGGSGSCEPNRVLLKERECVPRNMKVIFSAHMRRRAEAILKVLSSHGCASKVFVSCLVIALIPIVRLEEVKRTGAGGSTDPYVYVIS